MNNRAIMAQLVPIFTLWLGLITVASAQELNKDQFVFLNAASTEEHKSRQPAPRASVTFPPDLYQTLEAIAKSKKVSVAWVVRDAAEKYVADQWPLIERTE